MDSPRVCVPQSIDSSHVHPNREIQLTDQTHDREFERHVSKKPRLEMNPPQNNSGSAIFFKTRLCKPFSQGCCTRGNYCNYAHGLEELRRPPPNWQEVAGDDKSCGENYRFSAGSSDRGGNGTDIRMWKTKLCHMFDRTGYCSYGDKCQYAHGAAELRNFNNFRDNMELDRSNIEVATSRPPFETTPHDLPAVVQPACAQQTNQDEKVPKWPKKISLIYGDWPPYMQ